MIEKWHYYEHFEARFEDETGLFLEHKFNGGGIYSWFGKNDTDELGELIEFLKIAKANLEADWPLRQERWNKAVKKGC